MTDLNTQARLHRLAWTAALAVRPRPSRARLLITLSTYVMLGLICLADAAVIIWFCWITSALGPIALLSGGLIAAGLATLGTTVLVGGPANVLLARVQGGRVWTTPSRTAFAAVRPRKHHPSPFNHFARAGHGTAFRQALGHQLLREHGSILVRAINPAVRARYISEAHTAGLTLTRLGRRNLLLTSTTAAST
ncbi:hypothetical protein [Ruania zhangjianzhongii]|uniref:hypothetical protein n=1 Tax=Ruania zhangjianzhongii TaxID=2603206 RepID=UPI0011C9D781|nr:hypothetical protein [Ruania zhangjianzhongii]